MLKSIEICAGAGGQAIGLERAGFEHLALVEIEHLACETLRKNRPKWNVVEGDVKGFSAKEFEDLDLFAGGVPCPPFSVAGKQLGADDERDLFPEAIRLIKESRPKAIMLENVKGILSAKFADYRKALEKELLIAGYLGSWKLLNSSDFGVPQLRPRALFVGFRDDFHEYFQWPTEADHTRPPTVGEVLYEEMVSLGWAGADKWKEKANSIAPTLVGGSKKHGGADLGPTRAKRAWAELGVDGKGLADSPPNIDFEGMPRLTLQMTALIQGFPRVWEFCGRKTPAYRQVGNAFPPPVAEAVGKQIASALRKERKGKKWQKRLELGQNYELTF